MSNINWDKSFFLTAEQVSLLGLDGISINLMSIAEDAPRLAEALNRLTVSDLSKWAKGMDI